MSNTTRQSSLAHLSAVDVANYVVCPEAWRLKLSSRQQFVKSDEAERVRQDWTQQLDTSHELRKYAKIAYALLVVIVIFVFLLDRQRTEKQRRGVGLEERKLQVEEVKTP